MLASIDVPAHQRANDFWCWIGDLFFPFFIFIWCLWAPAAFTSGKLFAPALFVTALFLAPEAIKRLRGELRNDIVLVVLFLAWLAVSALWSPSDVSLLSGSLAGGDFSVDAPQIRFGITILAAGVLISAALFWVPAVADPKLPFLFGGAALFLLVGLLVVTPLRQTIITNEGAGALPSAQSIGRAVNLLAVSMPIAAGVMVTELQGRARHLAIATSLAGFLVVAIRMDGAAALIGLIVGAGVLVVFRLWPDRALERLFDALAAAVIATPILVWVGTMALSGIGSSLPVSAHQRLFIWEATVQRVFTKPLFGHGADASTTWHRTFAEEPQWLAFMPETFEFVRIIPGHPHNMALQVWVETGLVGAVLLAGALATLGRKLPGPGNLESGVRVAVAGVFGVAVTLFFVSYSVWDESFWASLAIVSSAIICLHTISERRV
ncbi:MAG: O-antigen ligase family protein [Pseudomonadota bacterium]